MDTKALSPEHPELKAPLQEAPTPAPLAAPRRRRWGRTLCIALGVTLGLAAVAVVSGVLTKVALDRQRDGEAAAVAAPAASPQSPGAGASSPAAGGRGAEAGDDREAFLPEGQSVTEETIYLPLQTDALMVEALDGPASRFAFTSPGPCRTLRQLSNISLDLSAAATGCRGAQCSITLKVLLPEATDECRAAAPAPFQTVYLLPGFSCQPHYYRTLTERLASWGWAVLTYERPLGGTYQAPAEAELAYFDAIMAWRNAAARRPAGRFYGAFATSGPVGVIGHSMGGGLAAILAGQHGPGVVGALVLYDAIDYTPRSYKLARDYLAEYRSPALVVNAGVQCLDRRGCVPPQDHTPTKAEELAWEAAGACKPDWECCSWDSNTANGVALASDGPAAFARGAARGSWLATFGLAGHTSLILEPGSSVFGGVTCPTVLEPRFLLPDSATLAAAFLEARLRAPNAGTEQHALAWAAARPPAHLTLAIKGAAV